MAEVCAYCRQPLKGRQRKWCSTDCQKIARRNDWILKVYGLSPVQYQAILQEQDHRCGCCGRPFKEGKTPHVDHEHGGHVRGIVCPYCNTRLIARLKSHELAQRLADYLRDPPAVRALGGRVIAPGRPKRKRKR